MHAISFRVFFVELDRFFKILYKKLVVKYLFVSGIPRTYYIAIILSVFFIKIEQFFKNSILNINQYFSIEKYVSYFILIWYTSHILYSYNKYTSIAHRIENPLRRTSEHITLHDLKH